jgi:hypothetical protein
MLNIEEIKTTLDKSMRSSIELHPIGRSQYVLETPFYFDDGDGFVIYLKIFDDKIIFTDNGHTIMHISYDVEMNSETRQEVLSSILSTHDLKYNDGEISTESNLENIGLAFWDFCQGLIRISDIALWKYERAKSLFFEEFEAFMFEIIKPQIPKLAVDWSDKIIDESGLYKIPYICSNGKKPLFVFPILNTQHCDQAIKSCLKYELANYKFNTFAAFADIEKVRKESQYQLLDLGANIVTSFDAERKNRAEKIVTDHFK